MTKLIGFFDCPRIKITQFGMKSESSKFLGRRHIRSNELKSIAHSHTSERFLNKQNFSLASSFFSRSSGKFDDHTKPKHRQRKFDLKFMCKFNAMECRLMTIVEICNFNVHQTVMLRMKKRSAAAQRREVLFHGNKRRDMSKGGGRRWKSNKGLWKLIWIFSSRHGMKQSHRKLSKNVLCSNFN